jgi:hypothetical protein
MCCCIKHGSFVFVAQISLAVPLGCKVKPCGLLEKILKDTNFFRQTLRPLHGYTGCGLTKTNE